MIERWIFLRDARLDGRTRLALAGLFGLALLILLPLRLVLGWTGPESTGLAARNVSGPVWAGTIADLRAGPVPLGTVSAGVRPLPLLIGRREIWLERNGQAGTSPFRAIAAGGKGWMHLHDVNGQVSLPDGLGALPVAGIGFGDFALKLDDGRCTAVSGTVSLTRRRSAPCCRKTFPCRARRDATKGRSLCPCRGQAGWSAWPCGSRATATGPPTSS